MAQPTQTHSPDAVLASEIAYATEHGDRQTLLEALQQHPDGKKLSPAELEELADLLMEDIQT